MYCNADALPNLEMPAENGGCAVVFPSFHPDSTVLSIYGNAVRAEYILLHEQNFPYCYDPAPP